MERGAALVTAILAVLKAGGAYVPLDPAYASGRLGATLGDSAPAVLVVDATGRGALGDHAAGVAQVIDVDTDGARWADAPVDDLDARQVGVAPHHLAYIIYTSGSTGRPKGVMVEHAQVVRLFDTTAGWFGFGAEDVWTLFHSIGFDFSVWELWGALLYGGRLVIVPALIARSPAEFYRLLCAEGVTVLNQTPSAFQQLIAAQEASRRSAPAADDDLRRRGAGAADAQGLVRAQRRAGDAAGEHVRDHRDDGARDVPRADGARRGPAGAEPDRGEAAGPAAVRAGRASASRCRSGVTGELYVGGAGVARGYLHRPELTAERFLADPFVAGERLYKTGDLGRWLPDGSVEYLGRNDFQVKIRGFRIELGEIEARLASAEGVARGRGDRARGRAGRPAAGGVLHGGGDGGGYRDRRAGAARARVARAAGLHGAGGLRAADGAAADAQRQARPQGAAGSRRRVRSARARTRRPRARSSPCSPRCWAELLGVERVGRRDDFFALGGHSLLAVRLVSRVRKALGVELALSDVFGRPELADMAEAIGRAARARLHAIPVADRGGPQPVSLAQNRLWFLSQDPATSAAYHITGAVRLRGALDRDALRRALQRIAERHEALRTCFREIDGEPMQIVQDAALAIAEHDLGGAADPEAAVRELVERGAARPFDLARDLPLRVALVRLADDDHVLHVVMHHLAADGWSIGVLLDELARLYRAYLAGEADPLPPLAIQYVDHAAWQHRWLGGGELAAQTGFWTGSLAGAPTLLELPTDRPRPAQQDLTGASLGVELGAARSEQVRALSRRLGVTPYVTLLASWAAALGRLSGQRDVVIGSPVAGRNRTELEPLIGCFVNTLALRVDLAGDPTVAELVGRTRDQVVAAQDHQDVPFDHVVEAVNPPRSRAHTPVFQVMFAWQNTPDGRLAMPGLALSDLGIVQPTVHCDLTLTLHDGAPGITGDLGYATALFDRATAERFHACWLTLLDAMLADAQQPIGALALVPEAERRQLLVDWNTMTEHASGACLHERFEAQVRRDPDAVALVHGDQRLTYGELNARANRLAHHLRARGTGPDDLVAICVDRGFDMLVALLAMLKAGGAYVPLDPAYASDRLAATLHDCRPKLVLLDAVGRAALGAFDPGAAQVIDLAADAAAWAGAPDDDLVADSAAARTGVAPSHLAYVIYTSGSTGTAQGRDGRARAASCGCSTRPTHGSASHGHDVWTLFHSFGFDFSVWEIWGALLYGGRLVVVPAAVARSPRDMRRAAGRPRRDGAEPDADRVPAAHGRRGAGRSRGPPEPPALRHLRRRGARAAHARAVVRAPRARRRGWSTCTGSPRPPST